MKKHISIYILFYSIFSFSQTDSLQKKIDSLESKMLSEVSVKTQKKLFERKVDRIIYNISFDIFSEGSNLIDAIKRAPRIKVENDDISIIGKNGNAKVMIDGRLTNLSGSDLKNKLKSLRTNQIKSIEIIPTPPSKYSSEGNSGIINIIMKKNEDFGLQGNANTDLNVQFKKVSTSQGTNINYKIKKIDFSANINNNNSNFTNENQTIYDFAKTKTSINMFPDGNLISNYFNTIIQYNPSKKLIIGSSIDFSKNKINILNNSLTEYYNKISYKIDSFMISKNLNKENSNNKYLSFFTEYKIDTLGKKINLIYNNSNSENIYNSFNESNIYSGIFSDKKFSNQGNNLYKINSFLLDFELPFSFGRFETGISYSKINNDSQVIYLDKDNNINYNQSNNFNYKEQTFAGYISFEKQLSKKISTKIGLRIENTNIKGYSKTLDSLNKNHYLKLFPTIFISYNPNENNNFSFSFSKRIDRPNFNDLNPFRYYSNAYNYISGNPKLLSVYTNSLELNYTLKNNFNIVAFGNYITNGISYLNEIDSNNFFITHPLNNYKQIKSGLILSYNIKIFKWNNLNINSEGYYTELISNKVLKNISGFGGSFRLRNSIELNQTKTSLLEIQYINYLPSNAEFTDIITKNQGRFGLNFKQILLNKNLVFNLYITDIFRQNISRIKKQYENYNFYQINDSHNQGFYLSASYNFGNKKVGGIYKNLKNQEKNRINK